MSGSASSSEAAVVEASVVEASVASAAPSGFSVRLARAEEYAAIDRLVDEAYAHDYGPGESGGDPMHEAAVRARAYEVWVAVGPDGSLLGSITLRRAGGPPLHEDVAPHELDLRLLGVSPRARRRGVGAALVRRAVSRAEETGFGAVVLKTAPNMHGAQRLYEALGFLRVPERDGLWVDGERLLDLLGYLFPLPRLLTADVSAPDDARAVLGRFPTGVVAVAVQDAEGAAGLSVQSFVSLSIDPPRVLLSVGRASTTWPRIEAAGAFAATVLSEGQGSLARRLARSGVTDKFDAARTAPSPVHGHPVLIDGAAWLECRVSEVLDGGDHRIVIADVLGFGPLHRPGRPLVFVGSAFAGVAETVPLGPAATSQTPRT